MNQQIEKEIECSICLETLKKPIRMLPCGHNFCQDCLEDHFIRSEQSESCPNCRALFQFHPHGRVDELARNRTLENIIDLNIARVRRHQSAHRSRSDERQPLLSENTSGNSRRGRRQQDYRPRPIEQQQLPPEVFLESDDIISDRAKTGAKILSVIFAFLICVTMITVGALNLHFCPEERFIPIWLIVGVVIVFVHLGLLFCKAWLSGDGTISSLAEIGTESNYFRSFNLIFSLFHLAWFITGCFWVYRNFPPNPNPVDSCDLGVFYTAFAVLTFSLFCLGCGLIYFIHKAGFSAGYSISLISFLMALALAVLGGLNLGKCPVLPFISVWLIIGSVLMLTATISLTTYTRMHQNGMSNVKSFKHIKPLGLILLVAWDVAGCFGVYEIYLPNFSGPVTDPKYCNYSVYVFSFVTATLVLMVLLVFIAYLLLVFCSSVCCKNDNN